MEGGRERDQEKERRREKTERDISSQVPWAGFLLMPSSIFSMLSFHLLSMYMPDTLGFSYLEILLENISMDLFTFFFCKG